MTSKKNYRQSAEVIDFFSEEILEMILDLEKKCFPEEWQYPDAREYYKEVLSDKDNVNLLLIDNGIVVGYLLGRPLKKEIEELLEYDPELKDSNDFYLETIQIFPEYQGRGGSKLLIEKMCYEASKKGFNNFSTHARISNKFNETVLYLFGKNIIQRRKLDKWKYGGNEPYEYIEWFYKLN